MHLKMKQKIKSIALFTLLLLSNYFFGKLPNVYPQENNSLKILSVSSNIDTVTQGQQNLSILMRIKNTDKRKDIVITTSKLLFKNGSIDISDQFYVSEQDQNPGIIKKNSTVELYFSVNISENADSGNITIDGEVHGVIVRPYTQLVDIGADITDDWLILRPASPHISAISVSQHNITQRQEINWLVLMDVQNAGGSAMSLDSAKIYIHIGSEVTHEYSIIYPTLFWNNGIGSLLIAANDQDQLRFIIDQTGITTGVATIQGRLWVTDVINQQQYTLQNVISADSVRVQTPALLSIESVTPSQLTVITGQEKDWNIEATIKNLGESSIFIDTSLVLSNLSFKFGENLIDDFVVKQPIGLDSLPGEFELSGGQTKNLVFTIDKTTNTTGNCLVTTTIGGYEINSGRQLSEDSSSSVLIITLGSIYILATENKAFNGPMVNTNQPFDIGITIFNGGAEAVKDVIVALESDGESSYVSPINISHITPGTSATTSFNIIASSQIDSSETFTAKILSAISENSGQQVPISSAIDSTAFAVIERPAGLQIISVFPSQGEVKAGRTFPDIWYIYVVVEDTGDANLTLNPLAEDNLEFIHNGEIQSDYIINPPDVLQGGGLNLSAGEADTLVYTVHSSGTTEGNIFINVNLSAVDDNDQKILHATGIGSVVIKHSAVLRIFSTVLNSPNPPDVNTEQRFGVIAEIENLGTEAIENVHLSMYSDGNSQLIDSVQKISYLPVDMSKSLLFEVLSDTAENLPGETFFVKIDSAISAESKLPASIKFSADDTLLVRIENPAMAQLELNIENTDGLLNAGKAYKVSANMINTGRSNLKGEGLIELIIPENYLTITGNDTSYVPTDTVNISVNEAVEWQIVAPEYSQGPDTLISRWILPPKDENTDSLAQIFNPADFIILSTIEPIEIVSHTILISPDGALDGKISTDQEFVIILPDNYSTDVQKTQKIINDTVYWTIRSPNIADQNEVNLIVQFSTNDTNRTFYILKPDTIVTTTVNKANLSINASISEPPEAGDGELSPGQDFIIRAQVLNAGQAKTYGLAQAHLDPGSSGITVSEPLTQQFQFIDNNKISAPIDWHATAPSVLTSEAFLTVNILTSPSDENTDEEAFISEDFTRIKITTREKARLTNNIQIVAPQGAKDKVLSTNQTFTIEATINSINCTNIQSQLILPNGKGFFTENSLKPVSSGTDVISWLVLAPGLPVQSTKLKIILTANDSENMKTVSQQDSIIVTVVEKATLQVAAQTTKSIVSIDETFLITAQVNKFGDAGILNEAVMQLSLPLGFTTPEDTIKETSQLITTWTVKAPNKPGVFPYNIQVSMISNPIDENTNTFATANISVSTLSILVEEKQLEIFKSQPFGKVTFAQGEKNVAILGLHLRNRGIIKSNPIHLRGIKFYVRGKHRDLISPQSVFSKIEIRNQADTLLIYGLNSKLPDENPVSIPFLEPLILEPGYSHIALGIYADISPQTEHNSFYLSIENNMDIEAVDGITGRPVNLVDEAGNQISVINLASNSSVILEVKLKTIFGNYPNPFGRQDRLNTKFVYYLDADSDGKIEIYTLTGDLVKVFNFSASDPQGNRGVHDGEIFWDGKNGNGHTVLSGVYVAVLTTSKNDRIVTKIAYIK